MKKTIQKKELHHKDCPSPEHPCFCDCHTTAKECLDCLCGRHKEKEGISQKEPEEWGKKLDMIANSMPTMYPKEPEEWIRFRNTLYTGLGVVAIPPKAVDIYFYRTIKKLLSQQRTQTIEEIKKLEEKNTGKGGLNYNSFAIDVRYFIDSLK